MSVNELGQIDRVASKLVYKKVYSCFTGFINLRDLFHVYLNKCEFYLSRLREFYLSRLHVNKVNIFCFLLNNGCVPGMTK